MENDFINLFFNQLGIKFVSFLFIIFITYLLSFFVLRIFKMPKSLDDQTLYDKLSNDVIPTYKDFTEKLENVDIESDELADVHEKYIEVANIQYNAFVKMLDAIEKQDTGVISEANEMLSKARSEMRDYQKSLKKLAKEHDVTIEEE